MEMFIVLRLLAASLLSSALVIAPAPSIFPSIPFVEIGQHLISLYFSFPSGVLINCRYYYTVVRQQIIFRSALVHFSGTVKIALLV